MGTFLWGVERLLLAAGLGLALWCAGVVAESQFFSQLPVPAAPVGVYALPGEEPTAGRPPASSRTAGSWVGRLVGPSVGLSVTVLEGSDTATLARGAGHIPDTAYPGDRGNVGIAGHRDTSFRPLRRLRAGDSLELTTASRVYRYRVARTFVVNPEDVSVLDPRDHETLTLVTCYPFAFIGDAPQRFIVQADLVADRPRPASPPTR
jgi:sortase A